MAFAGLTTCSGCPDGTLKYDQRKLASFRDEAYHGICMAANSVDVAYTVMFSVLVGEGQESCHSLASETHCERAGRGLKMQ